MLFEAGDMTELMGELSTHNLLLLSKYIQIVALRL